MIDDDIDEDVDITTPLSPNAETVLRAMYRPDNPDHISSGYALRVELGLSEQEFKDAMDELFDRGFVEKTRAPTCQ